VQVIPEAPGEPEPRNPNVVLAPGASMAFQERFVAVTLEPPSVITTFHDWVIDCPLGSVHLTVQPLMAALPAVTVTWPWKPPCHELMVW
jgi:hypothetical protein